MMRFQVVCLAALLAGGFCLTYPSCANAAKGKMGLTLADKSGVVEVVEVDEDSNAEKAGIMKGWKLIRIDGMKVKDTARALAIKKDLDDNVNIPHEFEDEDGNRVTIDVKFPGKSGGVVTYGVKKKKKK